MDSELERAKLQAAIKKIQATDFGDDDRSYVDIMLDNLAEHAAKYGWIWAGREDDVVSLQRGRYTIQFTLDPLDESFTGGTLITELVHDSDVFKAMEQLGASERTSNGGES